MNRTDRLVAMVMYFQGRRLVRAEELAEHFEVSVRTVYRDVAALSEAGVPVTGEAGVGYSLVKGYHLPPVMFTGDEAMALFVGAEMVKRFTDASLSRPMESAVLKLRAVLPREQQDDVDRLARAMVVAGGGALREGLDQQVLLPIQQAVVSRRVLRLCYRARGEDEPTRRDVEPLGVVFYGGAWYLVGWCRLRGGMRQFKLQRVISLTLLEERFPQRPEFSITRYLDEWMAVDAMVAVRVWFAAGAVERARRESYSGFIESKPVTGGVEARLLTFSLPWFARWMLSFGEDAEALEPEELRTLVEKEANQVLQRYVRTPDRTLSGA
ncbi:MAG: YafY family transcriptional regulator [Opitutaceae bacterium]|nr:YafY family transcriptional regulator [Opitutaceae bacterium]